MGDAFRPLRVLVVAIGIGLSLGEVTPAPLAADSSAGPEERAARLAEARGRLETQIGILGPRHIDVLRAQLDLARLEREVNEAASAEDRLERTLALGRDVVGEEHALIAACTFELASLLADRGETVRAEPLMRDSVAMSRRLLGADDDETLERNEKLAELYFHIGKSVECEAILRDELALLRAASVQPHPRLGGLLKDLGWVLRDREAFDEAEPMCREAVAIARRVENPETLAGALRSLGLLLQDMGDLAGAEGAYREAIDLAESGALPPVAISSLLNSLAKLLHERGDLEGAEPLYRRALEVNRSRGASFLELATSINNLARLLRATGERAEAEALYSEALVILEGASGPPPPLMATVQNNLASLLKDRGEFDRAEPFARAALAAWRAQYGENDRRVTTALNNLADLLNRRGGASDLDEAEALFVEALRIRRAAGDPLTYQSCSNLAGFLLFARARPTEAIDLYLEAIDLIERRRASIAGDEIARARFFTQLTAGGAFSGLARAHLRLAEQGNPDERAAHLEAVHAALERGRGRALLDLLNRGANAEPGPGVLTPREIAAALGPGEILLTYDVGSRDSFVVVTRPMREPEVHALVWPDGEPVDGQSLAATIAAALAEVASGEVDERAASDRTKTRPAAQLYRSLVPSALRGEIASATRVLLAGDGPLSGFPFEMLVIDPDRGALWIDELPAIVYGPSGTVLVHRRRELEDPGDDGAEPSPDRLALVALGDPRFGGAPVELAQRAPRSHFAELDPLPATREEIEAIAACVERSGAERESIRLLTGEEATATSLFAIANHPRFLHLATHAVADGGDRMYESALALTPQADSVGEDGLLRLADLLSDWAPKLERTELVTLSACRTARGRVEAGEGFVALTWGFLHAGAESVAASLWKVDDRATALLMARFYANLLGDFDTPRSIAGRTFAPRVPMERAEALHEAKRWLRGLSASEAGPLVLAEPGQERGLGYRAPTQERSAPERPYADAFFWAAFILIGEGR